LIPSQDVITAAQSGQAATRADTDGHGIPSSVAIAQYGLESGWGQHMPPGSFNPFGIKAVGGQLAVDEPTREFVHGHMTTEDQPFARFSSLAVAFQVHARLLATSFDYAKAREALPDPFAFADALTGVYATDPNYGSELGTIIRGDDLTKYDLAAAQA